MTKRVIIIIAAVIVMIFLVLIIQAALKPRPFNWNPSYSSYDKQPYGASIIFRQLKNIFPGKKVKRFGRDDFADYYAYVENSQNNNDELEYSSDSSLIMYKDGEVIYDNSNEIEVIDSSLLLYDLEIDTTHPAGFNVVMISDYFWCDELNARALLFHAYQGNDVFIAASDINDHLGVFLGLEAIEDSVAAEDKYSDAFVITAHDQLPVQLKSYRYFSHLTSYPDSAEVVATNKRDQVLGVKVKVGKGSVTYFTLPIIFTNYYMLKDDNNLAENLLVDLPNKNTYWGNMIMGKRDYEDQESLLSFIHSQESLSWAFYTIVISMLFLFAFQMKRKQRIIPVIPKPENDSLRFVEVISNLYLLNKDNKSLLRKKMTYFLEMIRSKYHLNTSVIDEPFFAQLATKSKVNIKHIKKIFRDYNILIHQEKLQNPKLLHFNKMIQHFKHRK